MLHPRGLYQDAPPERRTRLGNNPTLLYSWWCTVFSVVLICTRLAGRYIRNERLFREDKVMALSMIPLLARMGCIHVVLVYGTNNANMAGLDDPVKIHHREIGSKFVLAARIFYALFIWTAKLTVSEFLKRMTERFWKKGYELGLRSIRIFLGVTFIAVVIATLAECRPFNHYWQVIPDPGPQCRQGYAHLLTMGITDIVTDILLVCFPIPIIARSGMPLRRKISLIALFSMSVILIALTGARIPLVIQQRGIQQYRTVFASSEVLAAAGVSNAIVLGSFLRDRGLKKTKYKASSSRDSMDRRPSTRRNTLQKYASDEDLARSLGYRPNPELVEEQIEVVRPAQAADLSRLPSHGQSQTPFSNSTWQFPRRQSEISFNSGGSAALERTMSEDRMTGPRYMSEKRVSFYDVGGLLESGRPVSPSPTDSITTQDFAVQAPRRTARAASFHTSNGRSFPLPNRRRFSQFSEDHDPSRSSPQFDLRGFLSDPPPPPSASSSPTSPTSPTSQPPPRRSIMRGSVSNSHSSVPSLQDAGGLLSSSSS